MIVRARASIHIPFDFKNLVPRQIYRCGRSIRKKLNSQISFSSKWNTDIHNVNSVMKSLANLVFFSSIIK